MYPSHAPVHDPTAVMGKRFGAYIIDVLIGGILFFIVLFSFATRESFGSASQAEQVCDRINDQNGDFICVPAEADVFLWEANDVLLSGLVGLGFWFLNDAVLTGLTGFSIGKGIVGLRVVRQSDGRLCGLGRATARWAMWIADAAPWCFPLAGLVTGLASKGHRRVGDMVAGTFVVDKRSVGYVPVVPGLTPGVPERGATQAPAWSPPPQWGPNAAPPPANPWGPPAASPPTNPWGPPGGMPPTPPAASPPPTYPSPWGTPPSAPPPGAMPPSAPPPGAWAPPPAPSPWAPPAAAEPPSPTYPSPWAPTPTTPPAAPTPWAPPPTVDPTLVQPVLGEPPTQPVPVAAPVAGGPGVDAPLWDDARDAYIQWDPDINRWVQWDEQARRWDPI